MSEEKKHNRVDSDKWCVNQYEKFKNERAQPFHDLVQMLEGREFNKLIDLGCGTGELTAELLKKFNIKDAIGLDSSEEMLSASQKHLSAQLKFVKDKIENVQRYGRQNVVFSNAAIQWCENHATLIRDIANCLEPEGGQLAIQMPVNHDYPTHVIANELSIDPRFFPYTKGPRNFPLLSPDEYATLLFKLGFKKQNVEVKVYSHVLKNRDEVIEWVRGTLLTYFESRMPKDLYSLFLLEYREKLFRVLPDERPFFFPFKRILIWASFGFSGTQK